MVQSARVKSLVFAVTTDLSYDQRMQRICTSLSLHGYDVSLIGRKKRSSVELPKRAFHQVRLKCFFQKGKLFYIEYNIRLLLFLVCHSFDVYCAIDLDSILPVCLISKWRRKKFVYDAHEYFTEMEEVVARPFVKKIWQMIERWAVPRADVCYTVSDGYSALFKKRYDIPFEVIRNISALKPLLEREEQSAFLIYQGAVNVGRGLEQLLHSMTHIDCQLKICGEGDVFDDLQALMKRLNLSDRIEFCGYIEPEKLFSITTRARIGITLFTNAGLSNQYSLANRFFDYIHAGIPQIAINYPEYKNFNEKCEVALLIDRVEESEITTAILTLLRDEELYNRLRKNCLVARQEFNWQKEEKKLIGIYDSI